MIVLPSSNSVLMQSTEAELRRTAGGDAIFLG